MNNKNYTKVPNRTLEELSKRQLSGHEWRVITTIWRKTYGWQKQEDYISNRQLQNLTNLSKTEVSRSLRKLKDKNIVVKNGNNNRRILGFNNDSTTWEELSRKKAVIKNDNRSYQKTQQPLSKTITPNTEDDNKKKHLGVPKETITKEPVTKQIIKEDIGIHQKTGNLLHKEKHIGLAKLLKKLIENNKPDYVFRSEDHLDKWANDIRLMEQVDKRDLGRVEEVIRWALNHPFWNTIILSGSKLRKQFDRLELQYQEDKNGSKRPKNYYSETGKSRRDDKFAGIYED